MGQKLVALFNEAAQKGGGDLGKARLAMKVAMTEQTAQTTPDTPENVTKLEQAIRELWG